MGGRWARGCGDARVIASRRSTRVGLRSQPGARVTLVEEVRSADTSTDGLSLKGLVVGLLVGLLVAVAAVESQAVQDCSTGGPPWVSPC